VKLRPLEADVDTRARVLADPALRKDNMPMLKVAFRASFKLNRKGIWTDTARIRPGGPTRWILA
jgi:hypothetical protein